MLKLKSLGWFLAGLLLLAACQQQTEEKPPVMVGKVVANAVYLHHFGPPPQPEQGVAYARVGYLPLREHPERLRALPLFLFSEQDQLRQLLGRLVSGRLILDPQGALLNPFPHGTSLQVVSSGQGGATLDLTFIDPPEVLSQVVASLVETAGQFPEVNRVVITVAGQPVAGMPAGGFVPHPERVSAPGVPQPLMIAGMWEANEAGPQELLFNFDRPVTVKKFSLQDAAGERVEGSYYSSVFAMAVVVHPQRAKLAEGDILQADWSVVDALGRSASGKSRYPLLRFEH